MEKLTETLQEEKNTTARYNPNAFDMCDALYLDALIDALDKSAIPQWYYNIGGYADNAVCLEQDGVKYTIFFGERGQKKRAASFDDISNACVRLITELSCDAGTCLGVGKDFLRRKRVISDALAVEKRTTTERLLTAGESVILASLASGMPEEYVRRFQEELAAKE